MTAMRWQAAAALLAATLVTASCGADTTQQSGQMDYKSTKSMVLDILKTEDGQKAMQEAMTRHGNGTDVGMLQILSTQQGQQLQLAVKEVITKPEYATALQNMMIDPKFAGEFAKALQNEQKMIMNDLMKDPQYQQSLIDVMKNPDYERIVLDVMKGTKYREQMQTVIRETLQSPLYQAQMLKLLQSALEENAKPKPDEKRVRKRARRAAEVKRVAAKKAEARKAVAVVARKAAAAVAAKKAAAVAEKKRRRKNPDFAKQSAGGIQPTSALFCDITFVP